MDILSYQRTWIQGVSQLCELGLLEIAKSESWLSIQHQSLCPTERPTTVYSVSNILLPEAPRILLERQFIDYITLKSQINMKKNTCYIPLTKVIKKSRNNRLEVSIVAVDNTEIQIQIDKGWDDIFIDLSQEDATKLRDSLNLFLNEKHEPTFTQNQIEKLQSKVHEITGDGEVMKQFNELLGISAS
jgi:hypothetical protein